MTNITITDVRMVPGDSAFLIDDGKTAILYDTGFAFSGYAVAEKIRNALDGRPLDYIFLTHSHYDHALGAAYVAKRYPGVKIVASAYAAKIFSKPTARAAMRDLDRRAAETYGAPEYEDLIDDLRVDIPAEDGDTLICGDMAFTVIALPGHTRCSVGFYLKEQSLLLSAETLGVYFGENTYLPSCLVGCEMTLDSFRRARALDIKSILLPHYGVVEKEEASAYLENAERVFREAVDTIKELFRSGKTREEIAAFLEARDYLENVRPTYPIDAYRLNTGIMIDLIRKEFSL